MFTFFVNSLDPLVLLAHLRFFHRREIILDAEHFANLLRRAAAQQVGNSLAAEIEQRFDVEVVGSLRCESGSELLLKSVRASPTVVS